MKKFLHGIWTLVVVLAALGTRPASAGDAESNAPASAPPAASLPLSGVAAANRRAPWQQHLTLGPGDIISISLAGRDAPTEVWPNVAIGPDGRISYLQAHDLMAAGLTIDELRTNLDDALSRSTNSLTPQHTMIVPVTIVSKKYFVLGAVANKGVFPLNRPLTVMEAIALAGGLETGVFERNPVELADLSHSFMVRDGKHLPVDFEQLFQQGDLSQNVALEPEDYIYFASTGANEIYVLGEVQSPGTVPFTPSSSVMRAITTRGGYTESSFRTRVLVIRGSLNHPKTFVVDTADILKAKEKNFRLEPRDIVYVAAKPWQYAEDLLDEGTRAFITSVVVSYTGLKVGPFWTNPLIK